MTYSVTRPGLGDVDSWTTTELSRLQRRLLRLLGMTKVFDA
jgi:hypothetical protein